MNSFFFSIAFQTATFPFLKSWNHSHFQRMHEGQLVPSYSNQELLMLRLLFSYFYHFRGQREPVHHRSHVLQTKQGYQYIPRWGSDHYCISGRKVSSMNKCDKLSVCFFIITCPIIDSSMIHTAYVWLFCELHRLLC